MAFCLKRFRKRDKMASHVRLGLSPTDLRWSQVEVINPVNTPKLPAATARWTVPHSCGG